MFITIWGFVAGLAITNWNIALWISIDHFHFNDSLQWQQIGGWFRPEVCVYLFLLFSFWKSTRFFLSVPFFTRITEIQIENWHTLEIRANDLDNIVEKYIDYEYVISVMIIIEKREKKKS